METIEFVKADVIIAEKLAKHLTDLHAKIAELQAQIDALKGAV